MRRAEAKTRGSPSAGEAGFTLAEMLVVLVLLALLAGASTVALSQGREARAVASTLERLSADLRRTRIDAIRSGTLRRLTFDPKARTWQRETAQDVALPDSVTLAMTTAREAAGGGAAGGGPAIAFLPDGRSSGGRVDVKAGETRRSLVVDWLTGTVREAAP